MGFATAEVPRVTPDYTGLTVSSTSVTVGLGASLVTGYNTAVAQGKRRLILAAGWTGSESLEIGDRGASADWMEIVGAGGTPAEGTRITPALTRSLNYPVLTAPDFSCGIRFRPGARRIFIHGIRIKSNPAIAGLQGYPLIDMNPYDADLLAISDFPADIVLRHVRVGGTDAPTSRRFGVRTHAARCAILDSWIDHLNWGHSDYSQQSSSFGAYCAPGPLLVENSFIWRATEAYNFGGAGTFKVMREEQRIVSDITIRRNHIYAPLSLRTHATKAEGSANSGETKQSRRLLVEANICENVFTDEQNGYAGPCGLSANQQANDGPHAQVADTTIRYNWYKNHNSGFSLSDGNGYGGSPSIPMRRINIHNNFFTGFGVAPETMQPGTGIGSNQVWVIGGVADVRFANNLTIIKSGAVFVANAAQVRWMLENNLMGYNDPGGYFASGAGLGQPTWDLVNTNGDCQFRGNGCLVPDGYGQINTGSNTYISTLAGMGFTDSSKLFATTTKYAQLSALALSGGSALKNTAFGGGDPGPNWATVLSALSGVETAQSDLDEMEPT